MLQDRLLGTRFLYLSLWSKPRSRTNHNGLEPSVMDAVKKKNVEFFQNNLGLYKQICNGNLKKLQKKYIYDKQTIIRVSTYLHCQGYQ